MPEMNSEMIRNVNESVILLRKANDKKHKLKALRKVRENLKSVSSNEIENVIESVNLEVLPCFFSDSDSCRETAIDIVYDMISRQKCNALVLLRIFQHLVSRLSDGETIEKIEEIRLKLVQLLREMIKNYGYTKQFASYIEDIAKILKVTLRDQFSKVIIESCVCICDMAECLQTSLHLKASSLLPPTLEVLKHQHSIVRITAIYSIGALILHSNESCNDAILALIELLFDEKENVRKTLYTVSHRLLTVWRDRHTHAHLLIPILLSGLNDPFEQNRKEADNRWLKVGSEFLAENEEEYRDMIYYNKPMICYPDAKNPSIGCKMLVQKNLMHLTEAICNALEYWKLDVKLQSAQLLKIVVLHAGENIMQYVDTLLSAVLRVICTKDNLLIENLKQSAYMIGYYVQIDNWIKCIHKEIDKDLSCEKYLILACLMKHATRNILPKYLNELLIILNKKKICSNLCINQKNNLTINCHINVLVCCDLILQKCKDLDELYIQNLYELIFTVSALSKNNSNTYDFGINVLKSLSNYLKISDEEIHKKYLRNILIDFFFEKPLLVWHPDQSVETLILDSILRNINFMALESFHDDIISILYLVFQNSSANISTKLSFLMLISEIFQSIIKNLTFDINKIDNFLQNFFERILKPGLIWTPGQTSQHLRTAYIFCSNCLLIVLIGTRQRKLSKTLFNSIKSIQPLLWSLLDDNLSLTRQYLLNLIKSLIVLISINSDEGIAWSTVQMFYNNIQPKFDDCNEVVRIESFDTISQLFSVKLISTDIPEGAIEEICKVLVIHLDDNSQLIQSSVTKCFHAIGAVDQEVCLNVLINSKFSLNNQNCCDNLINYFIKN